MDIPVVGTAAGAFEHDNLQFDPELYCGNQKKKRKMTRPFGNLERGTEDDRVHHDLEWDREQKKETVMLR